MNERKCYWHVVCFLQKYVKNMEELLSWSQCKFSTVNTIVYTLIWGLFQRCYISHLQRMLHCDCCSKHSFLQKLHPLLLTKIHYDSQSKNTKLPLQISTRTNPSLHIIKLRLYLKICPPAHQPFLQVVDSSVCQL